jgi:hypothetical protein
MAMQTEEQHRPRLDTIAIYQGFKPAKQSISEGKHGLPRQMIYDS